MSKKQYMSSDSLIEAVKRTAMIPIHQHTFEDEDILAFATEEMYLGIVPSILKLHQDYYLTTNEVPLEANVHRYPIPHRAIGDKLRDISYVDENGFVREMTRIGVEDLPFYNLTYTGFPAAFYIEGSEVVLVPDAQNYSGILRMSFYARPSALVMNNETATIKEINRTVGFITVDNIPDGFSQTETYDFVNSRSPYCPVKSDVKFTTITNAFNRLDIPVDKIPKNLKVGDIISLAGTTCIPHIPADLHTYLMYKVTARCLEAIGDAENLQLVAGKIALLEKNTDILINSRVESAVEKIVNRHSTLNTRSYVNRKWRF